METKQLCEICHTRPASSLTLQFAKTLPTNQSASQEASPDVTTIKLPNGKEYRVNATGQQEVRICDTCFTKRKVSGLFRATGGCLATLLGGMLVIGVVLGLVAALVPAKQLQSFQGIMATVVAVLFLGLCYSALSPFTKARHVKKENVVITMKRADLVKQGFDLFWAGDVIEKVIKRETPG